MHNVLIAVAIKVLAAPAPVAVVTMPTVTIVGHAPARAWVCGPWRELDAVQSVRECRYVSR